MTTIRIATATLATVAAALSFAHPASAAAGKLVLDGCETSPSGPPVAGCAPLQGLGRTGGIAFSADGRSAYASFPGGISAFDRNPGTGELSFLECVSAAATPPCEPLPGALATPGFLGTASDLVVTQDGASLYAAIAHQTALVGFSRDLGGGLEFAYCRHSSYGSSGDLPSCPVGEFEEVRQLEASLDGRAVYLSDRACADNTGDCFSAVVAFRRDAATSALSHSQASNPATYGTGPFAVKGGSGTVYQADSEFGTISVFKRIGAASLKRVQCLWPRKAPYSGSLGCVERRSMGRARAMALSPNGRMMVTAVQPKLGDAALVVFNRARNGKLTLDRRIDSKWLDNTQQIEFSRDGRSLYAVSGAGADSLLARFKVNSKRGRIAFAHCFSAAGRAGCTAMPLLRGLTEISPSGPFIYASVSDAAAGLDALVRFRSG